MVIKMKQIKIHFLNTIWSDAILIEVNNHYGLIDTASLFYYPMVKGYLESKNIKDLDFIILTHFHSDHYGCMNNIINDFNVKEIPLKRYYGLDGTTASGFESNEEYIENEFKNYNKIIESANKNNTNIIYIDELNLEYLDYKFYGYNLELYDIRNTLLNIYNDSSSPYYHEKPFNENFNSIGIFIKANRYNIYLGADVTCSKTDYEPLHNLSIKMLEKIYKRHSINHIDIYKSCHHGGGGTNTIELCNTLKTRYAIITNTNRWLDNYPTLDNLKKAYKKVKIMQTDYQKIIFKVTNKIEIEEIKEDSLFLTLKKN